MFRNLMASCALLLLIACGGPTEYVLQGTERSAGTDGLLTVEDIEGNQMITVRLEHLPAPGRITEGATAYVVWIQPDGGQHQIAGRLDYDEDDRVGVMRATAPHPRFTVTVTAERNASATAPSDIVVARQRVGQTED